MKTNFAFKDIGCICGPDYRPRRDRLLW